ncbi:TetR/AcrR family transcriptional regulator C-terminal domain-containing protein [Micromonospora arborensis]|uniref:TetR/AcrR family transcriptional regulator n=1 Tax=Micromonospora arborensis TaxID=2116518 RepID=UPI003448273F
MASEAGADRRVLLNTVSVRRSTPPLSLQRIAAAAVELLDAEGISRLTMRNLADRLGVGTTTLYWHVDTKDDVLDLAVDAVFAESPPPAGLGADWRADITALITDWRATLLRHPWSAALPMRQRPTVGPGFLAWMEFLQASLVRAGLTGRHVSAASWVLYSHVQGSATSQSALRWSVDEREAGQRQLNEHSDRYPTLVAQQHLLDDDWAGNFELGLAYILDGVAIQITPQAA